MPVTVFTDSQKALIDIQKFSSCTFSTYLRDLIYQNALDLKNNGRSVTIQWIPDHVGLIGHDRADQNVKDKAYRGGKLIELWSSLTRIRKNLIVSRFSELAKVAQNQKR